MQVVPRSVRLPVEQVTRREKLPVLETSLLLCILWPPPAYMVSIGVRVSNIIILYYIVSCVCDGDDNNIILYSNNNNYYNVTFRRRQVLSTLSRLYVYILSQRRGFGFKNVHKRARTHTHTQKILYSRVRGKP